MALPYEDRSFVAGAKMAMNRWGVSDINVYYTLKSLGLEDCKIEHIAKEERLKLIWLKKHGIEQKSNTKQENL